MAGPFGIGRTQLAPGRAIVCGGLVVGSLDAIDALVYFGFRGASPSRIFQSIASGLLGRSAYDGGLGTVFLGVALHFFIAFSIVGWYYVASRGIRVMIRRPVLCGIGYGVLVYFFMNRVVIPLSAIGHLPFHLPNFVNGVLIHMFGVGLPSALFVWAAEPHVREMRARPE